MNSIYSALSGEENEILEKEPDVFLKICLELLNKHAPRKKKVQPG